MHLMYLIAALDPQSFVTSPTQMPSGLKASGQKQTLDFKKFDIYQNVRLRVFQAKQFSVPFKINKPKVALSLHTLVQ